MTQAEWWDTCRDDPLEMLGLYEQFPEYRRKWRLCVCACCEVTELLAADPVARNVVLGFYVAADENWPAVPTASGISELAGRVGWSYRHAATWTASLLDRAADVMFDSDDPLFCTDWFIEDVKQVAGDHEVGKHCDILRDIFGNPFRPVAFAPDWRTSAAVALADAMYQSNDFGPMPVLADALEEAGCDSPDVLAHCRGDGPHVRGCWVVDLVLGKS